MEGDWGRGGEVEIECIQWDVDRVVSGEKGDEMNGDVQWFVCLDRDGESEMEEGGVWEQRKDEVMRASNTLRRNPSVYRCCLEMRGNEEREQSVVTLAL